MRNFCALAAFIWMLPVSVAALEAAAHKVDITPDVMRERPLLAGFGVVGRKPKDVHDPLYARLLLLREGKTSVAIVGLDLLGFSRNDVEDLRARAGFNRVGRSLFVAATHTHSGPDTLGFWGTRIGSSGIDPVYLTRIKASIAAELRRLEEQLRPVDAAAGHGQLNPRGLCRDSRDPQVIDPNLSILRLSRTGGTALATIVNWSCHPVILGYYNRLITADFPGPLCAEVEQKGGVCIFLNGMIGGHLSPDIAVESFAESERVGITVADAALALKTYSTPSRVLAYHAAVIRVPVENSLFRLSLSALTSGHRLFDFAGSEIPAAKARSLALRHLFFGLNVKTEPWIETEVSLVDIGPARLLGLPAEVFPELAIGGYDGNYTFGRDLLLRPSPNSPDLAQAPKGPYLRDLVKARSPMLVGLANDELGYLVPQYDFKVRSSKFMLPRYPGHYEETFSIGPSATRLVTEAAVKLLKENP